MARPHFRVSPCLPANALLSSPGDNCIIHAFGESCRCPQPGTVDFKSLVASKPLFAFILEHFGGAKSRKKDRFAAEANLRSCALISTSPLPATSCLYGHRRSRCLHGVLLA